MADQRNTLGQLGEDLAAAHLRGQGYRIVVRNYRVRQGEVDLIAKHRGILVFVEVKTRSGGVYGGALEAVTPRKQRQLSMVALEYMARHNCHDVAARFDVVGVEFGHAATSGPRIEVVRNAFDLCFGV